jgi:hypothetical protein
LLLIGLLGFGEPAISPVGGRSRGRGRSSVHGHVPMTGLEEEVNRTWMWGPEAFTGGLLENYIDSTDGTRLVSTSTSHG